MSLPEKLMSGEIIQENYNQIPYPSYPYLRTHPNWLAALARLHGLDSAPIEQCRVLELGCASGGNLIPMAYSLPRSQFVGIDFAAAQIAQGRQTVQALQLTNISLEPLNLLEITPNFGQFDYIIAHGLYSWVPPQVREKLLKICRQNLAPNGVAYISYNTYPGWKRFELMREMMLYHTRHLAQPEARLAEAQTFLDFLAGTLPDNSIYGAFIKAYNNYRLQAQPGDGRAGNQAFLLHDDLGEVNDPVYFYHFVQHAARHGLQYLTEAEYASTQPDGSVATGAARSIEQLAEDWVDFEQYLDFLSNRMFRRTLLCHQNLLLTRPLKPNSLGGLYIASPAVARNPDLNPYDTSTATFDVSDNITFATGQPIVKAALLYLSQIWPQAASFESLVETARTFLSSPEAPVPPRTTLTADTETLAAELLRAYRHHWRLIELYLRPLNFTLAVSQQPRASALARLQLAQGQQILANLRHDVVEPDKMQRYLLGQLDGSQSHADLVDYLVGLVSAGKISLLTPDRQPIEDDAQIRAILSRSLQQTLPQLARMALLEA